MFVQRPVRTGDVIRIRPLYVGRPTFSSKSKILLLQSSPIIVDMVVYYCGRLIARPRICHCGRLIARPHQRTYTISVFYICCRQCSRQMFGLDCAWLHRRDLAKDRQNKRGLDREYIRSMGLWPVSRSISTNFY